MVKLDWNELQDQAGSNTYIRPDTSTRLYTNGDDIAGTENELVDFPKIMKELQNVGLTVLRWDRDERSFKRACIKVDDKLQGLYILDQEQKLIKELAIRDLNRVAHDAEAVKLFQQHQATDPHMDAKTCFFLIHSNWDGQPNAGLGHDVPADHAELIMAAPGQQLKMKIEAIMAAAPSPSEYSEANKDISARKIQSYSRYSALRKATKTAGRVLTDTVLLDAHGIFLKGTKTIDLQLLFNNQTKEVVKMPVSELDTRGCEQAGAMAAKNHNLNGADSARLGFAFQECHCMRQICVHLAPTVFPVYRFSATSPITHTLANDSAMAASSAELQKALKDMESQAPSKSSCALMKALQQTLDLEVDYQDAVNKAKQFKNVDLDAVLRQHLDESNLGPEYTGDIYLEVPLGGAPPTPKQKQNGQGGSISGFEQNIEKSYHFQFWAFVSKQLCKMRMISLILNLFCNFLGPAHPFLRLLPPRRPPLPPLNHVTYDLVALLGELYRQNFIQESNYCNDYGSFKILNFTIFSLRN